MANVTKFRIQDTREAQHAKMNALAEAIQGPAAAQGSTAATNVIATQAGGAIQKTVLTFTAASVTMTDATTAGSHGGIKVFDFPAGNIVFFGGTTDLTVARVGTAITTTAAVVGALGTTAAATDNDTLTGTEADFVPSSAATLTAGAGTLKGKSLTAGIVVFDGTSTAMDAYLNFAIPDAGSTGNDALKVSGTVTLLWANLGDN